MNYISHVKLVDWVVWIFSSVARLKLYSYQQFKILKCIGYQPTQLPFKICCSTL